MLERSSQVSMMRQIYQKAEIVNVWLGTDIQKSNAGMDFALSLEEQVRAIGRTKVEIDWISPLMQAEMQDPGKEDSWTSLSSIFKRPYWSRVWIVQELVSNLRTHVHVGGRTTHLMPLLSTGNAIWSTTGLHSAHNQLPQEQNLLFAFNSQAIVVDRYSFMDVDYEGHHLLDLLVNYRHHRCSDPRDKVYGFAALARPYAGQSIEVDYRLTASNVFRNAARFIISNTQRLDILCLAESGGYHRADYTLPSWVPDWNYVPRHWDRMKFDFELPWNASSLTEAVADRLPVDDTSNCEPNTTLDETERPLAISSDGSTLICRGFDLGSISWIHRINYSSDLSKHKTLEAFHRLLLSIQADSMGREESVKALWELFFSYQSVQDLIANALPLEKFKKICSVFMEDPPNPNIWDEYRADITFFFKTMMDRSIFFTAATNKTPDSLESKLAIGACAPCAKEEDRIVLLHACKMFVVLREKRDIEETKACEFELVCVASVNGSMYGEAMDKKESRDFVIR